MNRPRSAALPWKIVCVVSLAANAALLWWQLRPAPAQPARPQVAKELRPYAALGSYMTENNHIPELKWTPAQFDAFLAGMRDTFNGGGFPLDDEARQLRDDINRSVQKLIDARNPDPIEDYFRTLREKEGVKRTASGLHYRITNEGYGERPQPTSTVVISVGARLPGGEGIESLKQNRVSVKLATVIPGLREALLMMKVGDKALVYIPPALSFQPKDWPPDVPRGAPIVLFVELHDVQP